MYRFHRSYVVLWCLLLLSGTLAAPSIAQDKATLMNELRNRPAVRMQEADVPPEANALDINNQAVWVENTGFFNWTIEPFTGGWNGTFPKGTTGNVFAQGFVWGGQVFDGTGDDTVRVNGATYAVGLNPGKVLGTPGAVIGPDDGSKDAYHVWRVRTDWRTADLTVSAASFYGLALNQVSDAERAQIKAWYEYDWMNWPADLGAPYAEFNGEPGYQPATDANGNGEYDPEEGDIPGYTSITPTDTAIADQTVWLVANDLPSAEGSSPSEQLYGSPAIGIEYQLTMWAYNFPSTSALGNIAFKRGRIIYTGTQDSAPNSRIDSMYVTQWVDADVGDAGDDYAGSDTTLGLGYAYNSSPTDAQYAGFGLAPSAVGFDFLQGPIAETGDTLGMTSFVYFAAGSPIGDPDLGSYEGTLQWYNLMRGYQPRPAYPATSTPFQENGERVLFTLAGDPVTSEGFIDGAILPPGDRRLVLTTGPFDMEIGDTVDIVVGQISGLGASNLSSVTVLKYYDQFAQYAYDSKFVLPAPAPMPAVNAVGLDEQIVINWGNELEQIQETESWESKGFQFEGYEVYQLPSATSPLSEGVLLATYDLNNNVSVIQDQVVDEQTGFVITRPVHIGPDAGLQRYFTTDTDAIRNRPIANGVEYFYAVRNFSYLPVEDPSVPFRALASPHIVVSVTAQAEAPGVTEAPAIEGALPVQHPAGTSTAGVQPRVIDPTKLADATYEVQFAFYNPYTGTTSESLGEGDTLTTIPDNFVEGTAWSLDHRLDVGDPFPLRYAIFRNGEQISGWLPQFDEAGSLPVGSVPITDGFQLVVPSVTAGVADWYLGGGTRWVSWTNAGLGAFNGGADIGSHFLGSTLPDAELVPVVLEFHAAADTVDGWASKGKVFNRGEGYAVTGTGNLPFAAFELDADGNKGRQLNVSFVEMDLACGNLRWDMGLLTGDEACTADGGREYILVHKSDYNEGADYTEPADRFEDVLYGIWPAVRGTHPFGEDDFTLTFEPAIATEAADVFAFTVDAQDTGVDSLLAQSLEDINVFPNPYFGVNQLERSRYAKFVTFTHLPEQATIRVFNLAGIMVRVIEHESGQFEQWDLTNQDNIPVASGVYIAHIEARDVNGEVIGEKVLKLALVQEEQILERY